MSADLPQQNPDPQDSPRPIEVYNLFCNVTLARTQMQHKCGEMSLHVTEILGGAIAAVISAKASKSLTLSDEFIEGLTLGLIVLYALIQTLITANYIYHTYMVWVADLHKNQLVPQVYEVIEAGILQTHYPFSASDWRPSVGGWFVRSCQPLIPAGSAILGCVACLYYQTVWQSTSRSSWALFVFGSLGVFALFGIPLWWLQEHMRDLSVYNSRREIQKIQKARDARQTEADSP